MAQSIVRLFCYRDHHEFIRVHTYRIDNNSVLFYSGFLEGESGLFEVRNLQSSASIFASLGTSFINFIPQMKRRPIKPTTPNAWAISAKLME
jgi:hypothetical protein